VEAFKNRRNVVIQVDIFGKGFTHIKVYGKTYDFKDILKELRFRWYQIDWFRKVRNDMVDEVVNELASRMLPIAKERGITIVKFVRDAHSLSYYIAE